MKRFTSISILMLLFIFAGCAELKNMEQCQQYTSISAEQPLERAVAFDRLLAWADTSRAVEGALIVADEESDFMAIRGVVPVERFGGTQQDSVVYYSTIFVRDGRISYRQRISKTPPGRFGPTQAEAAQVLSHFADIRKETLAVMQGV